MWERMFDLVLGLKKEHRLMIVITLIYAVTLFGITVDGEENKRQAAKRKH